MVSAWRNGLYGWCGMDFTFLDKPIRTVKKINPVTVIEPKMVLFRITPDKSVTNNQNKKTWRLIHELLGMDHSFKTRFERQGWRFNYRIRDYIYFDIVGKGAAIERDTGETELVREVNFYMCVPELFAKSIKQKLNDRFPQMTIEPADLKEVEIPTTADVTEYRYKRHDIFSLKANDTEQTTPISSLINTAYDLQTDDFLRLSVKAERVDRKKWKNLSDYAYHQLENKRVPSRVRFEPGKIASDFGDIFRFLFSEVADILTDTVNAVQNSFFGDKSELKREKKAFTRKEYEALMENGELDRTNTTKKRYEPTFKIKMRLAVDSKDRTRKLMIKNGTTSAVNELKGDNYLEPKEIKINVRKRHIDEMNAFKNNIRDNDANIMSTKEIGKLQQWPTRELQEKYSDVLATKRHYEMKLPKYMYEKGLLLGQQEFRGQKQNVVTPINNWNELCLPTCAIGGMGSGKTGFGSVRLIEAVKNGFGGMAIDPAKHEIGNEIKKALNPDQYEIINIAKLKPSFDWCETAYSEYGKGLMADAVLSFFDDVDDAPQTERYLRAFVIGMQTTKLKEIFEIMENKKYLKKVIDAMKDGIHKQTLIQYSNESDAMRLRLIKPIYNRMDSIMGDPFLNDCFESDISLDFVELMSSKKAIIIDVAKKDGLTPKQINLIGNLLMTKINLAMQFRPEEKQEPFFVVVDEPHQFNRSAKLWENMAVEARKWRVAFVWLFHFWEQLPKQARLSIINAGSNYHIYPTSKETFKHFSDELKPYTLEDCLQLKRHHAFNLIQTHGETTKPFILKMQSPPSVAKKSPQ